MGYTSIKKLLQQRDEEKVLADYQEKANKILSEMQNVLNKAHKKIADHKYSHVTSKLKKYL